MRDKNNHKNMAISLSLFFSLFGAQLYAETRFYEPINLSNNSGLSFAPSVAVGAGGNVYVTWYDNSLGGNEILLSHSSDRGKTFGQPINLSNNSGLSTFPSVTVDINGYVHIAWQDTQYGKSEVLYTRSVDGGNSFSSPLNLSNDDLTSTNVKLASDGAGRIYATWVDSSQLSLSRSDNGGASFTKVFTYSPASGLPFNPSLTIGSDGTLHLVWSEEKNSSRAIQYARSTNRGSTFANPVTIATGTNLSRPVVAAGGSSNIYVAYINDSVIPSEIYFAKSYNGGASFSAAANITNNSGTSLNPSLAVDPSGVLYFAWQDTTPGNYESLFARSTDYGATFSSAVNIAPSTEGSLYTAVAVDELQNIYVAWDDNRYSNTTFEAIVAVGRENLPAIQNASVSPEVFSPNLDGQDDNAIFQATFTERLQWQLNVYNSSNTLVFITRGQGSALNYTWDGKDFRGITVPDGTYSYQMSGISSSGYAAISASGTVIVNTVSDSTLPSITSFSTDTKGFSPNSDGFKDSVTVSAQFNKSVNWTLTVKDATDFAVRTLSGTGLNVNTSWDGKDDNGQVVSDSDYQLILQASDDIGNSTSCETSNTVTCKSAKVDTIAPELGTFYATPAAFSPNGDGINDTTSIVFSPTEHALITIYIYEMHGSLVRELYRSYQSTGEVSVSWDGLSGSGDTLPAGSYTIKTWCRDTAGNTAIIYPYETTVTIQ